MDHPIGAVSTAEELDAMIRTAKSGEEIPIYLVLSKSTYRGILKRKLNTLHSARLSTASEVVYKLRYGLEDGSRLHCQIILPGVEIEFGRGAYLFTNYFHAFACMARLKGNLCLRTERD